MSYTTEEVKAAFEFIKSKCVSILKTSFGPIFNAEGYDYDASLELLLPTLTQFINGEIREETQQSTIYSWSYCDSLARTHIRIALFYILFRNFNQLFNVKHVKAVYEDFITRLNNSSVNKITATLDVLNCFDFNIVHALEKKVDQTINKPSNNVSTMINTSQKSRSGLPTQLIFKPSNNLEDYLDTELNNLIYDAIIDFEAENCSISIDALDIFNAAYLLCTRVMMDSRPENNFQNKYMIDDKYMKGNLDYLSVWTSYIYLSIIHKKYGFRNVNRFIRFFERTKFYNDSYNYYSSLLTVIDEFTGTKEFEKDVYLFPPLKELPEPKLITGIDWKEATNDFNQDEIRDIINLWENPDYKQQMLDIIRDEFNYTEEHKYDIPF